MGDNIYNPNKLVDNYRRKEHGKARISAIRYAMEQAGINNDLGNVLYFGMVLCDETEAYGNGLDVFVVFPELLAIADNNTSSGAVPDSEFYDIMGDMLWCYENLLSLCSEFYQIPLEDCINFHNDFKKRWVAYGRNPAEPYRMMAGFYRDAGYKDKAFEALSMLKASHIESYDCKGCIANTEIGCYLFANEKEKADRLAEKIEDGTFMCGYNLSNSNAVPRMHKHYLNYYLSNGDYEKAAEKAYILEHSKTGIVDYQLWASFMCAYVYTNTGRGLSIYKKHWKDIENGHRPSYMYTSFKDAACFFMGLKKVKDKSTIKLPMDNTFPLYNEENIYNIDSLASYYYNKAEDIAKKFDKRNGTDMYIRELGLSVKNILAV